MSNIYLNTAQLLKLLELEPEHSVTLAKLAADAVAEQVLRKIDRGRVVQSVIDSLNKEIVNKFRANKELDQIIRVALERAVNGKIELSTHDALHEQITKVVENVVSRKLLSLIKSV